MSVLGAASPRGSVVVDPRMRSRRIAVLRDAGRRRLRRALAVLAVLGAVVGIGAVLRSPLLDVDHVRAAGGGRTAASAVRTAAGIERGAAMIGLDTGAAAGRVEALPWVADARIVREWPGTVRIEIDERTAAATVRVDEGRWAQVDGSGRVLAVAGAAPAGLPDLTGVDGRMAEGATLAPDARGALEVLTAVVDAVPDGAAAVEAVSVDLDVTLAQGTTVRFGAAEDIEEKALALATVLRRVDLACLEHVDVTAARSPALTRHEGCS